MRTYGRAFCLVPGCTKQISWAGVARVAHHRMHVRRGELVEWRYRSEHGVYFGPPGEERDEGFWIRVSP